MLIACKCKHEYQSKKYGQKRVHNPTQQGSGDKKLYRCTVCATVRGR